MKDKPLHKKKISELKHTGPHQRFFDLDSNVLKQWVVAVVKEFRKHIFKDPDLGEFVSGYESGYNEGIEEILDFLIDRLEIREEDLK